jgi:hypothetical protein
MTRDDAVRLVKSVFKEIGAESPGLNEKGFGGTMLGRAQVNFEHREKEGELEVLAHVYTFRNEPKPNVLAALEEEARGGAPLGGGQYRYMPENKGVFLARVYREPVEEASFLADVKALAEASLVWRREVYPRALDRAFGHAATTH